jgi:hypothetical protein
MYCKKCGAKIIETLVFAKSFYDDETGEKQDRYYKRLTCPNNTKILGIFNTHRDGLEWGDNGDGGTLYLYRADGTYAGCE